MNICVISPSYPTSKTIDFVFVDQLCQAFADIGHKVIVIAPQSITKCLLRGIPIAKRHSYYKTSKHNIIEIFRPYTLTFGAGMLKQLFRNSFDHAVNRTFLSLKERPDVCYGHFWQSIFAIYEQAQLNNIPLFGASGEEDVSLYINKDNEYISKVEKYLSGIISVSSKNQSECLGLNLITPAKSIVIPNAINLSLFKKQEKSKLRRKYGINPNDFIVAFTGQFVPRKGALRLSKALTMLNDDRIKAIFMGSGSEDPNYKNIKFKGTVNHNILPEYLALADIFVLPTENEGCCNAIIEAMACGLPIVSTDAAFNHDILNSKNSIMVDCFNIKQIATAIEKLRDDTILRQSLANEAYNTAKQLSIEKRAMRIVEFMLSKLE